MSPFEYVSVLISIILGLGITQIVTGVADVIQKWRTNKLYLPHALWVVFVFFLHIQEWWVLYEMHTRTTWKLPVFLFTILYPIGLFILARLLFPSAAGNQPVSFKEFYQSNYRTFFSAAIVLIALSIIDNVWLNNFKLWEQPIQLSLMAILTLLLVKKPKAEWIHLAAAIILLLFLLGSLLVADWTLGANPG